MGLWADSFLRSLPRPHRAVSGLAIKAGGYLVSAADP